MSIIHFSTEAWSDALMARGNAPILVSTPQPAYRFAGQPVENGVLIEPPLNRENIHSNFELADAIKGSSVSEVVVAGRGESRAASQIFVWCGTRDEFLELWVYS